MIVAWPVFFGYATLALAALGIRRDRTRVFWLLLAGTALLLGLGPELWIAGERTGVPLPGGLLTELPLLSMLRKPDRLAVLALMGVAMLSAWAWRDLASRLPLRPEIALTLALLLLAAERFAPPIASFRVEASASFAGLAQLPGDTLVELPYVGLGPSNARTNLFQTLHGKRSPAGYLTDLAHGPEHAELEASWRSAQRRLRRGDAGGVRTLTEAHAIDWVVLHKTILAARAASALDGRVIWSPFPFVARELVGIRQLGPLEVLRIPAREQTTERRALATAFGAPVAEDEWLVLFAAGAGESAR